MAATDPTTDDPNQLYLPATLTIARRSGGDSERIMVRITDPASRGHIAELELSPHDLAMAITGRSEVPGTARVWRDQLGRLGMQRENITVAVAIDTRMMRLREGSWREALTALAHTQHAELFADDWRPFLLGDGWNKHRHDPDAGTYQVHLERWVPAR